MKRHGRDSLPGGHELAVLFLAACYALSVACQSRAQHTESQPAAIASRGDFGHPQPDDGQWPMAAKDYGNTRYSTLDQITTANVPTLKLAWTFSTGITRGQEAGPVVVGDTMYIVTPYPNLLYALDLKIREHRNGSTNRIPNRRRRVSPAAML